METTIINTTPAALREMLAMGDEPYRPALHGQVSFEDLAKIRRLANVLHCSPSYFLGRTNVKTMNQEETT